MTEKRKAWSRLLDGREGWRIKVPTILQMEATECGAASLSMILAHYGLWVPLEKIRQECGVNRDGSKASAVLRAARNRGCEAHGYRWLAETLREKDRPLILHWEFNHFVVLEGIRGDTVYLNDPAIGRRTVLWDEFRTSYTGVSLDIFPSDDFKAAGHRFNVLKAVAGKIMKDRWGAVFLILVGVCLIVPGLAAPVISQIFLDEILTKKHTDWMTNLMIALVATFLASGALSWMRAVTLTRWQRRITLNDSAEFFRHLLHLPMQFFQQRYAAEVASRIGFVESTAEVLTGQAATAALDLAVAVFYLLLLLQYSVPLTFISLAFTSVDIVLFFALRRHLTDMNMRIQQDAGKEYGTAINGLSMIESIKASGTEADFFGKWAGYRAKVLVAMQEVQLWSMTATILPTLLAGVNGALIMTIGGFSIMDGLMTAGTFVAFQGLIGSFQSPVNSLLGLGTTLQSTEMQLQRLNDVKCYEIDSLNYPEHEPDKTEQLKSRLSGELELENISFGYSPLEMPLFHDFNLHLLPGRWVAVVGSSGSGKSTLAKIVTGIYEEWSGTVKFDKVPRRRIPREAIVNSIAAVDQDIFLISGTVQENISLFDSSISRSDVVQAAKDACIHEEILKLDNGYEALVSEGGLNFSGGQRQRLEIARALAQNPSLLVLDEATSALDALTEQKVLENIRRRGCSCFIVAHRLSTIRDCDEIIVLSHGEAIERGNHRSLMVAHGAYARLVADAEKES